MPVLAPMDEAGREHWTREARALLRGGGRG